MIIPNPDTAGTPVGSGTILFKSTYYPGQLFSTLEEALAAGAAAGGGQILVPPGYVETTSVQLVLSSNVELQTWMGGGEISGPSITLPYGKIISTFTGGPAVLLSDVTQVHVRGMAFETAQGVPLFDIQNKSRHCLIEDCFFKNTGTGGSASGGAFKGEGGTGSAANAEHHTIRRCVILGDPAIVIGTTGETNHFNDSNFDDCILEGPTGTSCGTVSNAIIAIVSQGGNLHFRNPYSRGVFAAGQSFFLGPANGGSYFIENGEIQCGVGYAFYLPGGTLNFNNISITCTSGPTVGVVTGGQLEYFNVTIQSGTFQHNQNGGVTLCGDKYSQITGTLNWGTIGSVTNAGTGGGTVIGPGSGTWPANPGTGGVRIPGGRTTDILTNPPVSGTWYGPYTVSGFGYDATLSFPLKPGGTGSTIQVDLSPDGGTSVVNIIPSFAVGVAAEVALTSFTVPAGWSWRLTMSGSPTISAGTLFARIAS